MTFEDFFSSDDMSTITNENFGLFYNVQKTFTSQWIDGKMEDVHRVIIVIELLQKYWQANNDVL
jgi:hypothetical protein